MNAIKKSIIAAACAGATVFAGNAVAADSQIFVVGATITGICKFTSAPYLLAFGQLDPSLTTDAKKAVTVSYLCTDGTAASSILVNGKASGSTVALNQIPLKPGVGSLPATLTWTTPATLGTGFAPGTTPINFEITGTIPAASVNAAVAGTYTAKGSIAILP